MALPLPKVVPDVGPGGPLATVMDSVNALHNKMILRQINEIKKKYMPYTTEADINSKNAYARLVGLQPLGKILGNEVAYSNLPDSQKQEVNDRFLAAGGVGPLPFPENNGTKSNSLNNMPQAPTYSGTGQPSTNSASGWIFNSLKDLIKPKPKENGKTNAMNRDWNGYDNTNVPGVSAEGPPVINSGNPFVGRAGYKPPIQQQENNPSIEMDMTGGHQEPTQRPRTFAENAAYQKQVINQGAEIGKFNAKDINDIGTDQLNLSKSGASLDRLTNIIKSDEFQTMRNKIPEFQDKQLSYLKKRGTKAQQDLIGDFISTAEAYKAATVNSFAGKPLVREFDLANKIKIDENDTPAVAEGKIKSLTALKKIAEQKNDIILRLMTDNHASLGEATRDANQLVNVKDIEDKVNKSLERRISVTNKKTGETKYITVSEARKLGVPNV